MPLDQNCQDRDGSSLPDPYSEYDNEKCRKNKKDGDVAWCARWRTAARRQGTQSYYKNKFYSPQGRYNSIPKMMAEQDGAARLRIC